MRRPQRVLSFVVHEHQVLSFFIFEGIGHGSSRVIAPSLLYMRGFGMRLPPAVERCSRFRGAQRIAHPLLEDKSWIGRGAGLRRRRNLLCCMRRPRRISSRRSSAARRLTLSTVPYKRTRILFVAPPAYGHLFPLVPLAWALRGAGHDVRVASCGVSLNAATRAGLAAVNVSRGVDVAALLRRHKMGFARAFPPAAGAAAGEDTTSVFTELCDVMADGVVDTAAKWMADLIVYTPEAGAALIAATRLDIPAVFFSIGLSHTPALMSERYATMHETSERHHVTDLARASAWIDLSPASLRPRSDGWPMRYVQYNGGQHVAIEVAGEAAGAALPRVAVTLGTMVPFVCGLTPMRGVVEAARQVDATFVVAHGSDSARELGPLPPNVEVHSWIGLDSLVATCSAAIHHGGFGTTLAILAAGLPQMVLPQGADQFYNAEALRRRGAAIVHDDTEISADSVRRLLHDDALRCAAEELSAEIADMPPPAEIVPKLIGLVQ